MLDIPIEFRRGNHPVNPVGSGYSHPKLELPPAGVPHLIVFAASCLGCSAHLSCLVSHLASQSWQLAYG